jgi:hypothetical protein
LAIGHRADFATFAALFGGTTFGVSAERQAARHCDRKAMTA